MLVAMIITVVLVLLAVPMVVTVFIYNQTFGRRAERPALSTKLRYEDVENVPRTITHFYSGANKLTAYIYGEDNDRGLVVIAHGLGGGAEYYFPETLFFVENGWRVFKFDKTGSHASEGRGTRGLPQSAIDLDAALTYIKSQGWGLPIMLYGHSWGGYAVAAVLNKEHEVNAVVSLAAFAAPMEMLQENARSFMGGVASLMRPYLWLHQRILFGQNAGLCAVKGINNGATPVMILHGTADDVIAYHGASIINQRARITNPNVIFITHHLPHHNGHNNLLRPAAVQPYLDAFNAQWREAWEYHNHYVPEDVRAVMFAEIRDKASTLDADLMEKINTFFNAHR
ncbi:MAG: alpha/beta fold hydrolase [Defluviitaleaceae bacterium]|nr:alpha/beta fold hydrolase [Defluviitaleaceae bacterium]MCL2273988.1 alpha/beta fold hydrolase [Defluviitaleaceae bacterium]MCL2274111.1 alpha/beta fold hydrolase [Defluviitaleaceae bacterium]